MGDRRLQFSDERFECFLPRCRQRAGKCGPNPGGSQFLQLMVCCVFCGNWYVARGDITGDQNRVENTNHATTVGGIEREFILLTLNRLIADFPDGGIVGDGPVDITRPDSDR